MFYNSNPITKFLDSFYDRGDIGVQSLDPQSQFAAARSGVKQFNNQFYKQSIFAQILERITGTIDSRANLFARLRNFKDDPLAITMIDIFIEDGFSQTQNKDFYEITFSPINNSAEEDDLEPEDEETKDVEDEKTKIIQDEINRLEKKFLLKSKFKNILFDLFLLGEWMWETEYNNTGDPKTGGLISIKDNKLVDNIIGVYEDEIISSYIEICQSTLGEFNGGIREIPKDKILHLVLNPGTIRFYINEQMGLTGTGFNRGSNYVAGWNNSQYNGFNSSNSIDDPSNNYRTPLDQPAKGSRMLSKYIRTGRSVLYSSLKTLEKLALLDMTNLALLLKRALSPTIMNVQVPESYSYKRALEAATAYEQWFYDSTEETRNTFSQTGVDNINFNRILELSQKFKCMPVWGDSKGALQTLDLADTRDNREAIQDIKDELSLTSGIPYYYFNPQAGGMEKKEMLKTYAKYARKLHILQQSVANSVIELHYKNLKCKGYDVNREDLAVKFKAIVNADSLESIEEIINLFTAMSEIVQALDQFASSQALHIRVVTKAFMKYFRFITQSYPFIQDMLEEAPEQTLTDNPDLLVGNMGPGMMQGVDPNMNPEDAAAMQQQVDPATGQPVQVPQEEVPQEAYELFGTNNLNEGMSRFKHKLAQKLQKKIKEDKNLNEAITTQPYRYSSFSF